MNVFVYIKETSERVPGKNFRALGGEPLWRRCLRKFSGHRVFVDTDSPNLVEWCAEDPAFGHVTAYLRDPAHIRSGRTTDLILRLFAEHVLSDRPVAITHVTHPFLAVETVEQAAADMEAGGYDSALSVSEVRNFGYRQAGDAWVPLNHDGRIWPRTQDLEPFVLLNHAFYIVRRPTFLRLRHQVGERPLMVPVGHPECVDIDWEDDWQMAEAVHAAGAR